MTRREGREAKGEQTERGLDRALHSSGAIHLHVEAVGKGRAAMIEHTEHHLIAGSRLQETLCDCATIWANSILCALRCSEQIMQRARMVQRPISSFLHTAARIQGDDDFCVHLVGRGEFGQAHGNCCDRTGRRTTVNVAAGRSRDQGTEVAELETLCEGS